ncbi:MAG TPA: hypothetical protein VGO68_00615 [Pyrinomonadaceae bacterium]|jgi:hypothetical protein|nr:hypothetical protein [Pyrinomonadaceae bacterium]
MAPEIPAPGDGGDIIIKGSSCEIQFNDLHFQKDENEALLAKHHNDLRITRIVITGDATFTQDFTEGFTGEIIISYEP